MRFLKFCPVSVNHLARFCNIIYVNGSLMRVHNRYFLLMVVSYALFFHNVIVLNVPIPYQGRRSSSVT